MAENYDELADAERKADRALDVPNADPDDDLRTISRQFLRSRERERALKADLFVANLCDVCTGAPIAPGPCICGGTGRSSDEKIGLRKEVHRLQAENEGLRGQLATAQKDRSRRTEQARAAKERLRLTEAQMADAARDLRVLRSAAIGIEQERDEALATVKRLNETLHAYGDGGSEGPSIHAFLEDYGSFKAVEKELAALREKAGALQALLKELRGHYELVVPSASQNYFDNTALPLLARVAAALAHAEAKTAQKPEAGA